MIPHSTGEMGRTSSLPVVTENPAHIESIDVGAVPLVSSHSYVRAVRSLALQEKRRDATFIRSHEVGRPEPNRLWCFRIIQNRPCRKRDLIPATGTLPALRCHDSVRTPVLAAWAEEAVRPAALSQILPTSLFGSEHRLELAQGFGKRWARHAHMLVLGVC